MPYTEMKPDVEKGYQMIWIIALTLGAIIFGLAIHHGCQYRNESDQRDLDKEREKTQRYQACLDAGFEAERCKQ